MNLAELDLRCQVLSLKPTWDEALANMIRNQETVCDWTSRDRYQSAVTAAFLADLHIRIKGAGFPIQTQILSSKCHSI